MPAIETELVALSRYLEQRRDVLLRAWRTAVFEDPALTTGQTLPRAQLNDHIPAVLSAFEKQLAQAADTAIDDAATASVSASQDAAAHGLHRWQQGYDLREVTRELGRLNECMVVELEAYAEARPQLPHAVMSTARRLWASACSVGIEESTGQYFRLQQMEAAGHVKDLETALESIQELEQQRADLWQQVAHDLRGNVGVVANVTRGLTRSGLPDPTRERFLRMLERNVGSLHHLLDDVTSLARLQSGREQREVAVVDIGALLHDLCEAMQSAAAQRQLYLRTEGPASFVVEADAVKTRRLAQNLVLNAIKYTNEGGVVVRWGDIGSGDHDGQRWLLEVQDTGPGFHAGPGTPLAGALESATRLQPVAEDTKGTAAATVEAVAATANVAAAVAGHPVDARPVQQGAGEGIGLSIVKRLCELLDATVQLESGVGTGTTFRVLLPRVFGAGAA